MSGLMRQPRRAAARRAKLKADRLSAARRAAAWAVAAGLSAAPLLAAGPTSHATTDATRPSTRPADPEPSAAGETDADLTPADLPAPALPAPPVETVEPVLPPPERFSPNEVPRESWEGVARRLAASLVDPAARLGEEPLFLPDAGVWRFGRSVPVGPAALRGRFDGQVVAAVLAGIYPQPGWAAAAGEHLRLLAERDPAANVSAAAVRRLIPRPDQSTAAELAMSRWLAASLRAEPGSAVAVLVLWDAAAGDESDFERLTFLLVKAGRLPDGRYRLQTVRFGTGREAVAEGF